MSSLHIAKKSGIVNDAALLQVLLNLKLLFCYI